MCFHIIMRFFECFIKMNIDLRYIPHIIFRPLSRNIFAQKHNFLNGKFASNVILPLLKQAIWGHIGKHIVEKSQTYATNATMHPLEQAIWGDIWKRTVLKSKKNNHLNCKSFKWNLYLKYNNKIYYFGVLCVE